MAKGKEGEGMKAKGIPVIARYYQTKKSDHDMASDDMGRIPYLFFPSCCTTFGTIVSWTRFGEHSEASIEFYRECKPMEKEEAEILVKKYRKLYPHEEEEFYTIKQKINYSQLRKSWKGGN
jgi:hypothetical protein